METAAAVPLAVVAVAVEVAEVWPVGTNPRSTAAVLCVLAVTTIGPAAGLLSVNSMPFPVVASCAVNVAPAAWAAVLMLLNDVAHGRIAGNAHGNLDGGAIDRFADREIGPAGRDRVDADAGAVVQLAELRGGGEGPQPELRGRGPAVFADGEIGAADPRADVDPRLCRVDFRIQAGPGTVDAVQQVLDRLVAADIDRVGLAAAGDLQAGRIERGAAAAGRGRVGRQGRDRRLPAAVLVGRIEAGGERQAGNLVDGGDDLTGPAGRGGRGGNAGPSKCPASGCPES